MTTRKRFKRLVRARAARTGESYTTALRHFRDQTPRERAMSPMPDEPIRLRCSFCGKYQDQVKKIVAGPGVYICDECVMLCVEIVAPHRADAAEAGPVADAPVVDQAVEARVREYVDDALARLGPGLASSVDVRASPTGVRVDIVTRRPGLVIGPGGATIEELRSGLARIVEGDVALNVVPVPSPGGYEETPPP